MRIARRTAEDHALWRAPSGMICACSQQQDLVCSVCRSEQGSLRRLDNVLDERGSKSHFWKGVVCLPLPVVFGELLAVATSKHALESLSVSCT